MAKFYVSQGEDTYSANLYNEDNCPKPRLAVKNDNSIYYLPLTIGTPPVGSTFFMIKQAATVYYILMDGDTTTTIYPSTGLYPSLSLYPSDGTITQRDLSYYRHSYLQNYTQSEIESGKIK